VVEKSQYELIARMGVVVVYNFDVKFLPYKVKDERSKSISNILPSLSPIQKN
jgi:hypothetical protein